VRDESIGGGRHISDWCQSAGRNTPAVVVSVVNCWSEWHGDWNAIALSGIDISVSAIEVLWIHGVNPVIVTEWRQTFAVGSAFRNEIAHVVSPPAVELPGCATSMAAAVVAVAIFVDDFIDDG